MHLHGSTHVVRVLAPIVHVHVAHTADKQLELALVEDVDQLLRDELVEAAEEGLELLLDALDDAPVDDQVDVFLR